MIRLVIVNPCSGSRRGGKYAKTIKKVFNNLQNDYTIKNNDIFIEFTEYIGHATEIVLEYNIKYKNEDIVVYVVGGDGTISEVASAINSKRNISLVVVPKGTGNDFSRAVNSYKSIRRIIKESISNDIEKVDAILVKNRVAVNMINTGLDAAIGDNLKYFRKIPLISGNIKYKLSILYTIFSPRIYKMKIRIDDKIMKGKYTLVAIGNNKYCGGGIKMLPKADIQDGYLDICIVKNTTLIQKLIYLPKLVKGEHEDIKVVDIFKGKKITISSSKKLPVSIDGEIVYTKGFIAKISEKTLSIIKTLDK